MVLEKSKLLHKWNDFLRDAANKIEVFAFLSETDANVNSPEHMTIFTTRVT